MKTTKAFYLSSAWEKCRAFVLVRDNHLCQPCLRRDKLTPATVVHHIKSLDEYPELALDPDNLESCCGTCHNKAHPEKGKKKPEKKRKARVIKARANREEW